MNFSKMHGLGNDFVVIDAITQNVHLSADTIKRLSDRHTGIGFDQLLIVEPPYSPETDFHYRIFNADGNEVEPSGNGARCFARFVRLKGLTKKRVLHVSTQKGVIVLTINNNETVKVNMGEPNFDPSKVPFKAIKEEKTYIIRAQEQTILCGVTSIGAPHCILQVDDVVTAKVNVIGAMLESHERFPQKANIGFMQVIERNHIKLRVFERSLGETKASGCGACASVAIGVIQGLLDNEVKVTLPGGELFIEWQGVGFPLYMTGAATHVYDGFIAL